MAFGQSVLVRFGMQTVAAACGADPATQEVVGRTAGWITATLTADHHSQAIAEVAFGGNGPCENAVTDLCHKFVDTIFDFDNLCDNCGDTFDMHMD